MLLGEDETREQLKAELEGLRQRVAELEALEDERKRAEEELARHRDHLEGLVGERTAELKTLNWHLKQQIAERERAEQALERTSQDLRFLNLINNAANQGYSLPKILQLLVQETKKTFSCNGVTFNEVSEDGKYLVVQNISLSRTVVHQIEKLTGMKIPKARIRLRRGSLYWKALQAGKPQLISDPETIQGLMAECTENKLLKKLVPRIHPLLGIASVMQVPLISEGEVIGLVDISRKRPFTESELERFAAIAQQLLLIIERKQAEEALRESEEFNASLLENAPNPVMVINPDTSIRYVNPALEKLTGFTLDEVIGKKPPRPWWIEGITKEILDGIRDRLPQGGQATEEVLYQKKNGERFWVNINTAFVERDGELLYTLANWVDITERKRMEEKYRAIVKTALDGIGLNDLEGRFLEVNDSYCKMTGYTREELLKMSITDIEVIENPEIIAQHLKKIIKQGYDRFETRHRCKDGQIIDVEISVNYLDVEGGRFCVFARDITERKQAEEKYQAIVETALDSFGLHDLEGRFLEVNDSCCKMFGYTREELLTMSIPDIEVVENPEMIAQHFKKIIKQGYDRFESRHKRKDGQIIDAEVSANYLDVEGGRFFVFVRDITERKQAEEALRESEEKYRTIFENVSEVIIRVDRYGKIVDVNGRAEECFGYKPEEVIGKNFAKTGVLSLKDLPKMVKLFGEIIRGKRAPFILELEARRKDGSPILIEVNSKLVKKNGKAEGFVAIVRDITERKKAEEALQAEKNKLQSVIDAIEYGLSIQDRDYNIIYQNQPMVKAAGDHLGEKCYRAYEAQEKVCPGCPVEKVFKDGQLHTLERKIVSPSGRVVFLEQTACPVRDAEGKIVSCIEIPRNITERKRVEEAVRESEEKYRGLVTNVKLGVFRSTPEPAGRFLEVNPAMAEITGYPRKELLKMNVSDLYVNPEERKVVLEEIASGGGKPTREARLKKKDGTEIVISDTKVAVRDDSGQVIYFDGILEDITERKQAEEREKGLQQELNLASRLAAVGELAAGVAHEMNNPLTGIMGFSERLLRKSGDDDAKKDLEIVHSEAQRLARVVKNLLAFARQREPAKEYADINDIMQKTLELRAYELKSSNIEVALDLTANLPQIMVDFHQIQEVFLNIILNAEQVMAEASGGGQLTIKTRPIKDYVRISFTDDGPGIPAEHLDRVFNPFFTTKGERGGTGLGLSVCHGIVTEHGGRIYARSKPGSGATFLVDLPLTSRKIGESQIAKAQLAL